MILAEVVLNDFWFSIIGSLIMIVVAMLGFWLTIARSFVTRDEVASLLADNIINRPEISDMIDQRNQLIEAEIQHLIEAKKELSTSLKENTEAINELKIQLIRIKGDTT